MGSGESLWLNLERNKHALRYWIKFCASHLQVRSQSAASLVGLQAEAWQPPANQPASPPMSQQPIKSALLVSPVATRRPQLATFDPLS